MPTSPDIRYRFIMAAPDDKNGGDTTEVAIHLEPDTHGILPATNFVPPQWARLEHRQCAHCPLDPAETPYCPIALNLARLLPERSLGESFDALVLEVETPQRQYRTHTTLQRALSSLFGLICALSDCPHTRFLRPMALFHLPVSTETETLVRVASLWLLGEHLKHRDDPSAGAGLAGLDHAYRHLDELNRSFVKRFRSEDSDAPVNAMVLLQVLARDVNWELDDQLEAIAPLFR